MLKKRTEDSYIIHDILPLFSEYGYPSYGDRENLKIKGDVKIKMGATYKEPDLVYYSNGIPVLLVEAKIEGGNEEKAKEQARSYIRNFPIEEYSRDGRPPQYAAITIGRKVSFYRYENDQNKYGGIIDRLQPLRSILTYDKLRQLYGLKTRQKPVLTPAAFKDLFYQLISALDFKNKKIISRQLIFTASQLIFEFLKDDDGYVSRQPYTELDDYPDRQKWIRSLLKQHDWSAIGEDMAFQFRHEILRSFQGGGFNQYMTEQCVIDFMWGIFGKIDTRSRVLDFECGSGGFLASAVARNNLPIRNILGIDIDELPYTVAKTYLALYFKEGRRGIVEKIIQLNNGLFYYGNDWDVVVSNPAGGSQYKHGNEKRILREGLRNLTKKIHKFSEYELSVQQAVRSARVGGKLCLILPDGFFSNSHDEFLRKYIGKYCRVLAIVGLPRGVFRVGTSVRGSGGGSHIASMKMSILYAKKIKEIEPNINFNREDGQWSYRIFMASVEKPKGAGDTICDWLKRELDLVLFQWKLWKKKMTS